MHISRDDDHRFPNTWHSFPNRDDADTDAEKRVWNPNWMEIRCEDGKADYGDGGKGVCMKMREITTGS